jgi:prepilin-type N-terminal cleavage/methylation domain-containing protein
MKAVPESRSAFSLIEILVAMAILTMLMAFMFALLGSTIRLWEQGNNQVEAAQAARIGLNRLAEDMQSALAASVTSARPGGGAPLTSVVPFLAEEGAASPRGWSGTVVNAAGSDQVFGVRAAADTQNPFREFGYTCVFVSDSGGVNPMRGLRYYLVNHSVNSSSGDFYLNSAPSTSWADEASATSRRAPVVDNCLRLELLYATNSGTGVAWTRNWASQTSLPLGVLATVITIDSRTAERVAQLTGGTPLSAADISSITNSAAPSPGLQTVLRNGSVVMRRFIPFRNSR